MDCLVSGDRKQEREELEETEKGEGGLNRERGKGKRQGNEADREKERERGSRRVERKTLRTEEEGLCLGVSELTAYWGDRHLAPKDRLSSAAGRFKTISMGQRLPSHQDGPVGIWRGWLQRRAARVPRQQV